MTIQIYGDREKRIELYDCAVELGLPVEHGKQPEFAHLPNDLFITVKDEATQAFVEDLVTERHMGCVLHP